MLQINVIREKATEAEVIVKGITQDIQRLDVAKRNLTGAIQTAERWGMLSESLISHQGAIILMTDDRTSLFGLERATAFQEIQGNVLCPCCELFTINCQSKLMSRS